jgi:hypothetical protein
MSASRKPRIVNIYTPPDILCVNHYDIILLSESVHIDSGIGVHQAHILFQYKQALRR